MSTIVDQTDVYITGVLYQENAYPDSSVPVFSELDEAFRTILGLSYEYFHVNKSECRFSDSTTREQLLIFLKNVTMSNISLALNDDDDLLDSGQNLLVPGITESLSFLTDAQSDDLRQSIIDVLNTVSDITYDDVEIRTTREETL
jgi:hypothetical protein